MKPVSVLLLALSVIAVTTVVANGSDFTQTTAGCVSDPQDQEDPRGEVLRFCAAVSGGEASFGVDVEEVLDPNTDPTWTATAGTSWDVDVETTGDSDPDYSVWYRNEDGFGASVRVINLESFATECTGTATFEMSRYVAEELDVAECFGGASDFRARTKFRFSQDDPFVYTFDETAAATPGTSLPAPLDEGAPPPPPTPPPPPPPPPPSGDPLFRLAGPTRIDTAIDISQYQFPDGAAEVYLSRQDVFADSISSGSLTRGPILLVPQCGAVPRAVLDEVARLAPSRVGALGGELAVCNQVLADVGAAAGLS
jgi:hypothetical protein